MPNDNASNVCQEHLSNDNASDKCREHLPNNNTNSVSGKNTTPRVPEDDSTTSKHVSTTSTPTNHRLNDKHFNNLVNERGLDRHWVEQNCYSGSIKDISDILYYNAKSGGIVIDTPTQLQVRPDKPWGDSKGKKAPKYRTPLKDDYDAILPINPDDPSYWTDIEKLKSTAYNVDGTPCLLVTEGGFKAIAGCSNYLPTIGLCGVEMGLVGSKHDPEGKRYLIDSLRQFAGQGFGFIIAFDADCANNTNVVNAEKKLAFQLGKMGALVYSITGTWSEDEGKGMDDFIQANGIEAFREKLVKAELVLDKYKDDGGGDGGNEGNRPKPPNPWKIAEELFEKYHTRLAWDTSIQEWRRYGAERDGIWEKEVSEFVRQVFLAEVEAMPLIDNEKISPSVIKNIEELMQWKLSVKEWGAQDRNLLPLQNGVLDLKTGKLMDHSPSFRLTWRLPITYDPNATCEPIQDWLLEACEGDTQLVELMRVYLYGVVTGRTDWQKYLELIGCGGTGKSTFIRLAIALVGQNNYHTTTLKKLEGSRFETACIKDKRLVVITDSERYSGNVSTLKALTGQDTLPYEVKMKQSMGGFTPQAMVIVAANEMIQSGDYTSGLERRRLTVPFRNKIPESKQRDLIGLGEENQIHGEFSNYMAGLLNWVLAVDPQQAKAMVKDYAKAVPSLGQMKAESLVETNPIADWLDNAIVLRPDYKSQIGVAKRDKQPDSSTQYYAVDQWLYANYCEYCANTQSKPIGLRRFVSLLSDLTNNQLGLSSVKRERDRYGRYFVGLKIRTDQDDDPALITGQAVTGVTDSVTDSVTGETPMSAKCDGCDGLIKQEAETNNQPTSTESNEVASTEQGINQHDPSQSHNLAPTGNPAVTQPSSSPSPTRHSLDFSNYPSRNSDGYPHKEKKANKCKNGMLACQTKEELDSFKANGGYSDNEIQWVLDNALSQQEESKIKAIASTNQASIFSQTAVAQTNFSVGEKVWLTRRQDWGEVIEIDSDDPTSIKVDSANNYGWIPTNSVVRNQSE